MPSESVIASVGVQTDEDIRDIRIGLLEKEIAMIKKQLPLMVSMEVGNQLEVRSKEANKMISPLKSPIIPQTPIGHPPASNNNRGQQKHNYSQAQTIQKHIQQLSMIGTNIVPFKHEWEMSADGSGDKSTNASVFDENALIRTAHFVIPQQTPELTRERIDCEFRFGEFGVMNGQFSEPSGLAITPENEIAITDTNNHRIQVFTRSGHFRFQFGEFGKRDGQMLYPNRVAINMLNGDFIVTERSPTHQIQVYDRTGHFLRKFGANILQHPRGICVDYMGNIVVVECKVMRVIIFDLYGNVLHKFGCCRYLEFPNGICTNDRSEVFISDNRAHCVKVFNYEGAFVRHIGGPGITNFPVGVGIDKWGQVVISDNHNNFNITVFDQEGQLKMAYESTMKHAQCFDAALMLDGYIVLASKDYRVYSYRYQNRDPLTSITLN